MEEKLAKFDKKEEEVILRGNGELEAEEVDEGLNREVEKQLILRDEPIRLFGETDRQRIKRLKLIEAREEERSGGQRNDFNDLLEGSASDEEIGSTTKKLKTRDSISEYKSILDMSMRIDRQLLTKDRESARVNVNTFFQTLISEWRSDLDERPEDVKKSTAGRLASATFEQTKEYLKPFFRMLNRDELSGDILSHVVDIVGFLQAREYVRANDTYLRMSIGNAPWPIGVTMVGIHERSAHEKINTGSVAHALNDEVTRKWIQSIKRLMTFCQKKYPPSEASKAMG